MFVELYTKQGCSACAATKIMLETNNIPFKQFIFNEDFTREFLIEKFSSAKTFPVVVVDGYHIGGYLEMRKLLENKAADAKSDSRKFLTE
jgi:glutaredoxin